MKLRLRDGMAVLLLWGYFKLLKTSERKDDA